ncbi:MAG: S41 family peptidase [Vicinamibacteria bacterium]|nr:S41 family peptidase [Vicinamibacteria bacterium]
MNELFRRLAASLMLAFPVGVAAADEPLSAAVKASVLDSVVARLESTYVDTGAVPAIVKALRERQGRQAYDAVTNPAQFAEMVTRDLRSVNGDLHLGLRYSKDPAPPPGRGVAAFGDPRLLNFGMGKAEILDGNVGYLEITAFTGGDYRDAVVDALRFLSRTDAVILDVRRNGGGASDMSHFIFSHFFGSTPVPTIDVRTRASSEPNHRMSLADVPGPRRPDVPLFVLISQATGSAAEEFSFVLKNRRRATLVGRRTAGAGHMVSQAPVGHGFTVSVSITRVSDPLTGAEWEQVGVQPDLAVPPEQALVAAHAAALRAILPATADASRGEVLRRLIETDEAKLRATPEPADRLQRLVGAYEGREVSARDGQLWYTRRSGGLGEPLVALGGDVYALGAARLRFADSKGAMTLTVEQADGTRVAFVREPRP